MSNKDAAVFLLFGQSNATGHALPMSENEVIRDPLKNVFGLSRGENQSFHGKELIWSHYTSSGMNLAEQQDDTYSVANCLAAKWQKRIDAHAGSLPDLYIVHISVGAQGVSRGFMWNPQYDRKLIPGKLGTVDIALYPFAAHILSLLKSSFDHMGKNMKIIGLHWRGGEDDMCVSLDLLSESLEKTYETLFDGFTRSVGEPFPIILHKMVCDSRADSLDPSGAYKKSLSFVNSVFQKLAEKHENISVFNIETIPGFNFDTPDHGVFMEDHVHYTEQVNKWVAEEILNAYADSVRK